MRSKKSEIDDLNDKLDRMQRMLAANPGKTSEAEHNSVALESAENLGFLEDPESEIIYWRNECEVADAKIKVPKLLYHKTMLLLSFHYEEHLFIFTFDF